MNRWGALPRRATKFARPPGIARRPRCRVEYRLPGASYVSGTPRMMPVSQRSLTGQVESHARESRGLEVAAFSILADGVASRETRQIPTG
jgi:hypothetical protein